MQKAAMRQKFIDNQISGLSSVSLEMRAAHDHGKREEHVEDVENRAQTRDLVAMEFWRVAGFCIWKSLQRSHRAPLGSRLSRPPFIRTKLEEFSGCATNRSNARVGDRPRCRRASRPSANRRSLWRMNIFCAARCEGQADRRAEVKVMTLRIARVDEGSIGTEGCEHRAARALLPVELEHLGCRRIDRGERAGVVRRRGPRRRGHRRSRSPPASWRRPVPQRSGSGRSCSGP